MAAIVGLDTQACDVSLVVVYGSLAAVAPLIVRATIRGKREAELRQQAAPQFAVGAGFEPSH